jgi:hypothetical protein
MGVLADFDLSGLIADYGCRHLVETGTGVGRGVDEALKHDFRQIFSIEIMHKLALEVALRHSAEHRVTIIHGKSEKGLLEALAEIPPAEPALFWLDAHYPGADFRLATYDSEKNHDIRLPLERELRLLAANRDIGGDVILIDDLRIYEDADYDEGPCPDHSLPAPEFRHLRFVDEILGKTHRIERSTRRTGYLCAYPLKPGGR